MKLLITGGTGLIGSHLSHFFCTQGYQVTILTRDTRKNYTQLPQDVLLVTLADLDKYHYDVVINLAGEPLATGRWTAAKKQKIYHSRIDTTQALIDYFMRCTIKPKLFITGSAIGFYGNSTTEIFTEQSKPNKKGFAQKLCDDWEHTAAVAETLGIRTCYLRTGLVLANNGGLLKQLLPTVKLGLGAVLGSGQQTMSWIHITDYMLMVNAIIKNQAISGPINMVAPHPVSNREFMKCLATAMHRPCLFSLPAWLLRLLFGAMADELLLQGQRVIPEKMLAAGYLFKFPELSDTFSDLF